MISLKLDGYIDKDNAESDERVKNEKQELMLSIDFHQPTIMIEVKDRKNSF